MTESTTPADEPIEVEIEGKLTWDKRRGTISLDIETSAPDVEYGCLSWLFAEDDPEWAALMDVLEPPPLD